MLTPFQTMTHISSPKYSQVSTVFREVWGIRLLWNYAQILICPVLAFELTSLGYQWRPVEKYLWETEILNRKLLLKQKRLTKQVFIIFNLFCYWHFLSLNINALKLFNNKNPKKYNFIDRFTDPVTVVITDSFIILPRRIYKLIYK